ncbi:MAG: hypothetical protein JO224_05245 [Pelomonas sp.]|nr:hypothetical protein [Roseateles sp.]
MIYLIDYDRRSGTLIEMRAFLDAQREVAQDARLELELSLLAQGTNREVVLLEAANESDLRRTHGRYFETIEGLAARGVELVNG